ncbi:LysM peptidoglycan-binding domain-containing protein [Microbacterium kribbense]|uniref:LysM peptidoglycan-binding domain-containing protein n=1 Tax=Microbacterium kribbense TaxID=433645 RepID=UPI003CD0BBA1
MPAAIAGSLALSLAGAPAHAAEAAQPRHPMAPHSPATAAAATGLAQMSPDALAAAGALAAAAIVPISVTPFARTVPATYKIVRGDTVSAIAARFGLRTTDVLAWNKLGWSSVIYPGQTLRLKPTSSVAKAPAHKPTTKPAAHRPAAKPTGTAGYTVRSGDTVSAIARRFGQSTQAVLTANKLRWSSIIYPGQKLVIPGQAARPAAAPPAPKPAPRPTPAAANPAPANQPAPASVGADSYVVRAGDTMSAIAARNGVSVTALLSANGMDWASIIYPGQQIRIPSSGIPGLSTDQAANARLIARIGRQLGVSDRGIAIALGTSMQESGLRNLDYGDRDSLGLFQQRPSTGWGTAAQVRDPDRSIRAFFGGAGNPNRGKTRGLLDISGWQQMDFADAAQAVQISAYPSLYAQWEKPAYAWLAAIG